ncbi:hypothetical protein C8R43DRAFT_211564 [Mycena crocata]|nr:hypothetical protein C8R43DRAFT_211564 [Mycena crocata]
MASQWEGTLPWIAIEPVARSIDDAASASADPPSYRESQFDIILRRQRTRSRDGGGLKHTLATSSRFLNLSSDFEFAGWGSFVKLKLTSADHAIGDERLRRLRSAWLLGQFTGTALPGNAVLGSVFYSVPAIVAVCTVYSPLSLFVATLTPFLWRPIMEDSERVSALPITGAPYSYILNTSRKSLALLGAALLLLDFASTSATASSYLAGETSLPFPTFVPAALILLLFALVSLSGLKESARLAFGVMLLHGGTMAALAMAAAVHWRRSGSVQLRANWLGGQAPDWVALARQLFNGLCIGMLGLTGIECACLSRFLSLPSQSGKRNGTKIAA